MHRSVTGSSLRLAELNDLVDKAGESEVGTPNSRSGRTPRSQSGMSLGSRSSSIIQVSPPPGQRRLVLSASAAPRGMSWSMNLVPSLSVSPLEARQCNPNSTVS